jgi:hypothetical protein
MNFFSLIKCELIAEYIIGFAKAWVGLWEFKRINGNAINKPIFSMFNKIGFLYAKRIAKFGDLNFIS